MACLLFLALILCMLRWFEHRQVFIPSRSIHQTGAALGGAWEDISFEATDGTKLNGWYFPAKTNSPSTPVAVLLCHGNAGNISHRLDYYDLLLQLGVSVFAFDYRGYGRSSGRPTEEGTYLDAVAAYRWLNDRGFGTTNIIVLGESLGGAVATELALRAPLAGIILVSTFSSIPALGKELFPWLPVNWMCTIRYDTSRKLPRLKIPALLMHSRSDTLVGYHHAEKNFAAANEPKSLWEIYGDHNDTLSADLERYREGINQFLKSLGFIPATERAARDSGRIEAGRKD
jgi:fermentation-respiration switch protein FrsA (DUF1100 family)